MMLQFTTIVQPPCHLIDSVASLNPTNPFYTSAYTTARAALGGVPCLLTLQAGTETVAGCTGFLRGNFLTRALEIPSVPTLPQPDVFWHGLSQFCHERRIWDLYAESFASETSMIPRWSGESSRRERYEYIVDLTCENPLGKSSINHQRNASRARKAGLRLRRTRDSKACSTHLYLLNASMERRQRRGEQVSITQDAHHFLALLISESGELFQAVQGDAVLSSILILKAKLGAYYQSAGTLPEGMRLGASPFLIAEVANVLKQEGIKVFNLGGASGESPGLQRFKAGFGTRRVSLQAASFSMVSPIMRKLRTVAKLLRARWPLFLGCSLPLIYPS